MITSADFEVFEKYKDAGQHAFSNNVVSEEDKHTYQRLFDEIKLAAQSSISALPYSELLESWSVRFFREGGVQGHRPVDLWVCVINRESRILARYPQIYMIASSAGIEMGFTVAIHEGDYYNAEIKLRNRSIVPVLYTKLPGPSSDFVQQLDEALVSEKVWKFGIKSRQGPNGSFGSLTELVTYLKSPASSVQGGGSIYRIISPQEFDSPSFDLQLLFKDAVALFFPFMRRLVPNAVEEVQLTNQKFVDDFAKEIPSFSPEDLVDGRKAAMRLVAVRQGQAKFREKLLDAYNSRCAVTGTGVVATLQAAHIVPYRGEHTNVVQNGILLRADIHNLFDLGHIQIDPYELTIELSAVLLSTPYGKLAGRKLRLPKSPNQHPSQAALGERRKYLSQSISPSEVLEPTLASL